MLFPLDEREFMKEWLLAPSNKDNAYSALGEATVQAINQAYYAGFEAGRKEPQIFIEQTLTEEVAPVQQAEICRNAILDLIGGSDELAYLQAVYSFAESYPHRVVDKRDILPQEKYIKEIVDILRKTDLKTQKDAFCFVREYCGQHDCISGQIEPANASQDRLELICRFSKKLMS